MIAINKDPSSNNISTSNPSTPGHMKPPPLPARNRSSMISLPNMSSNNIIIENNENEESNPDEMNQKNRKNDPDEENEDVAPPPLPPPRHSRIEATTPPPPQLPPRDKRASSFHESTVTPNATTNMNSAINNQTPQKKKRNTTALSNVSRFISDTKFQQLMLLITSENRTEKLFFTLVAALNANTCLVCYDISECSFKRLRMTRNTSQKKVILQKL